MTEIEKAIRDFCGHHADWWPSTTQVQEMLALAQPEQEPMAYDKTELNCFAQDLYDQKMREGRRGHYESMFHVIHQCIKKVAPQPEQDPVAWISTGPARMIHWTADKPAYGDDWAPLYATPPQRKPLTIKNIKIIATYCDEHVTDEDVIEITRRVEAAHGIKGD